MTELLTAEQMRSLERAAIDSGAVTGLDLMERAGAGVVEAVLEEWPDLAEGPHCAVVLCGPGNNGGDGFVVARLLHARGWQVEVFHYGDPEKLPPDARVNYERWGALGQVKPYATYEGKTWGCDLLVDALFGTGLTRGLREFGELFWNMEDMVDCFAVEPGHELGRPAIVAVDIPSGICADSGRSFPHEDEHDRFAATAHLTVTFHRAKLGHYLAEGPERCGKTVVKPIGLTPEGRGSKDMGISPAMLASGIHPTWLRKTGDVHKYGHGHALIL